MIGEQDVPNLLLAELVAGGAEEGAVLFAPVPEGLGRGEAAAPQASLLRSRLLLRLLEASLRLRFEVPGQ